MGLLIELVFAEIYFAETISLRRPTQFAPNLRFAEKSAKTSKLSSGQIFYLHGNLKIAEII